MGTGLYSQRPDPDEHSKSGWGGMGNFLFEGDKRTFKFVINQIKYLYHKKKVKPPRRKAGQLQGLASKGSEPGTAAVRKSAAQSQPPFSPERDSTLVMKSSTLLHNALVIKTKRASPDL